MSEIVVRPAQAGEAHILTALCVRSKAHWGYDDVFMRLSQASLAVSDAEVASGHVLVGTDRDRIVGVARVEADGELRLMFVADPNAAPFYERMGARFVSQNAPSDAIPGRTLPLYEYDLTHEETP